MRNHWKWAYWGMILAFCMMYARWWHDDDMWKERQAQLQQQIKVQQQQIDLLHDVVDKQAQQASELRKQLDEHKKQLISRGGRIDRTNGWNVAKAKVTAYSPFDDRNGLNSQGNGRVTSTGKTPGYGKFAVDPKKIPYGSEIIITYADGSQERGIAEDTGGAMRQHSGIAIDVFRRTYDQAIKFGKREEVEIRWKPPMKKDL